MNRKARPNIMIQMKNRQKLQKLNHSNVPKGSYVPYKKLYGWSHSNNHSTFLMTCHG